MDESPIFKPVIEATNHVFISYAFEKFRNIFRFVHALQSMRPSACFRLRGLRDNCRQRGIFVSSSISQLRFSFIGFAHNCISFLLRLV